MAYGNFKKKKSSAKARGLRYGYRSGLEEKVAVQLKEHYGKEIDYEKMKLKFEQPAKMRTYTPDFVLPNGIIIETKGRLTVKARKKHLWVQEQHPDLDIRFVFSNPNNKIYKGSKTSYGDWCEQYDFKYAKKLIPKEWLEEEGTKIPQNDDSIEFKD